MLTQSRSYSDSSESESPDDSLSVPESESEFEVSESEGLAEAGRSRPSFLAASASISTPCRVPKHQLQFRLNRLADSSHVHDYINSYLQC
jgi:hypothetical protein